MKLGEKREHSRRSMSQRTLPTNEYDYGPTVSNEH